MEISRFFPSTTIIIHHTSLFCILWSIISLCHHVSFYVMSDGFFSFQCMKDNHIPHHSQFIDIGSEILNWEDHLVRESSSTSLFESISISLCILGITHLLIFKIYIGKRKKKSACIYICIQCHFPLSLYIVNWELSFLVNCLWEFVFKLSKVLISSCLSCYVLYVWEIDDLFLETSDHYLLHHYIHWWFDCFSWLDLSGLVLIHFPSIYLFF